MIDPFSGVASTAKAAALIGRFCTCVEVSPYFVSLSKQRFEEELQYDSRKRIDIICGDIRKVIPDLKNEYYDLMLTSPPYWGILNKVDHKAKQERIANGVLHNYGNNTGDLSNIREYGEFLNTLAEIFDDLSNKIRLKGHAVIIVGDFRHRSRFIMFHSDLANEIEARGSWQLKGIKVMYQKHKRVFPYGYPYAYVPNLHHQYALVFQRLQ